VTVDQYSAFIADGGYGENANDENAQQYWDEPGWAWRHNTDSFQNAVLSVDKKFRRFSDYRTGELRALPWDWADQQRIGSRALRGINWFEARAYVRWLNAQLKQRGVFSSTLANYCATLPNESEREIAARAQKPEQTYALNRWPWGDDAMQARKQANISYSHIDHVSVPGCFAPNDWGLLDMAGNVFEWQDVLFSNNPYVSTVGWKASGSVPTSGSSFFTDLDSAACSNRVKNPAVHGGNYVGLRVMLSQRGLNN
jgi:formylglycine-generating enzyme required for sulfatase activity